MSAKHTKGPWKEGGYILWPAHGGDAQYPIHAPKRGRIAMAYRESDARLIASAPQLLEALRGLHDDTIEYLRLNNLGGENNHWLVIARAAIQKATKEPS